MKNHLVHESDVQSVNYYEKYEALKKEYDEFTYLVSHDLNAPLRHIQQFSSLLLENLSEKMSSDDMLFAGYIEQSIDRCQNMIESLLELSHITTNPNSFQVIDVEDIVHAIIKQTSTEIGFIHAASDMPSILGDRKLFRTLFSLLIDNAIKFKKTNYPLNLSISGTKLNEVSCVFELQDNGIGIAEDKQETVFEPFRKSSSTYDIPGAGMGLTICRKIVSLHEGKIWFERPKTSGSLLKISLPAYI